MEVQQEKTKESVNQAISDIEITAPVSYTHLTLPTNREV